MSPEVHTLTGAYALHALDELEQRRFEAHLAACPDCTREVGELSATATRLGLAVAERPPARLRARVLAEITGIRQLSPNVGRPRRLFERWPWVARVTMAAAVVVLAGAGTLGVLAAHTEHQVTATRSELAQTRSTAGPLVRVLSEADARTVTGAGVNGVGTAMIVASSLLDDGVLTVTGMPRAAVDHTYQAWLIGSTGPRSVGLLGPSGTTGSPLLLRGLSGARELAVTMEPTGGSAVPTTIPALVVALSA